MVTNPTFKNYKWLFINASDYKEANFYCNRMFKLVPNGKNISKCSVIVSKIYTSVE